MATTTPVHSAFAAIPPGAIAYVLRFTENEEKHLAYDSRPAGEVVKAWIASRAKAFTGKQRVDPESAGVFALESGGWLVSAIESVAVAGPLEVAELNELASRTNLRMAQAQAILTGQVDPADVGRDGEVIPFVDRGGETDETDDDETDDEGELEETTATAPTGFAGLTR